jgi:hypothetical protein
MLHGLICEEIWPAYKKQLALDVNYLIPYKLIFRVKRENNL